MILELRVKGALNPHFVEHHNHIMSQQIHTREDNKNGGTQTLPGNICYPVNYKSRPENEHLTT